jgi:hypothetical protein
MLWAYRGSEHHPYGRLYNTWLDLHLLVRLASMFEPQVYYFPCKQKLSHPTR